MSRLPLILLASACLAGPVAAQSVDRVAINGIIDQGLNHSAGHADRRLSDRPDRRAHDQLARHAPGRGLDPGSSSATGACPTSTTRPFEFGRGWSIESLQRPHDRAAPARADRHPDRLDARRPTARSARPSSSRRSTSARDFAAWKRQAARQDRAGHPARHGAEPTEPAFKRLTDEELAQARPPTAAALRSGRRRPAALSARRVRRASSTPSWRRRARWPGSRMSHRDGGLVHGEGYRLPASARPPTLPGIEIAAEDYRRLAPPGQGRRRRRWRSIARSASTTATPRPTTSSPTSPARDRRAGYVMAGAHLDSWVAGDGAADNGAGSRDGHGGRAHPRRHGRQAQAHDPLRAVGGRGAGAARLAGLCRPASRDRARRRATRALARGPNSRTWRDRWPITPRAGYRRAGRLLQPRQRLGQDPRHLRRGQSRRRCRSSRNGSSRSSHGRDDGGRSATPAAPTTSSCRPSACPASSSSRIRSTTAAACTTPRSTPSTTCARDDLRQAAVILAAFLLNAANSDEPLPRMPLPTQPTPTDPFEYLPARKPHRGGRSTSASPPPAAAANSRAISASTAPASSSSTTALSRSDQLSRRTAGDSRAETSGSSFSPSRARPPFNGRIAANCTDRLKAV